MLNYFSKLLQGYMNSVIASVAILYEEANQERVLENTERCQGSLILLMLKNCSQSPNNYRAGKMSTSFNNVHFRKP